jgi:hypothetical protein
MIMSSKELAERVIELYEGQSGTQIFDGRSIKTLTIILEMEIKRIRRVERKAIGRMLMKRANELENDDDPELSKEEREKAAGLVAYEANRLIEMSDNEFDFIRKEIHEETDSEDEEKSDDEGFR